MRLIPLTQGKFAQVDDEDFMSLNQYKWFAHKNGNNFYAIRNSPRIQGKQLKIRMHEIILGNSKDKMVIDHIDHDGLNNQKKNLRFVTVSQNCKNKRASSNGNSKYLGVYIATTRKKYLSKSLGERIYTSIAYQAWGRDRDWETVTNLRFFF